MRKILSNLRWFFTGVRLFVPLVPHFVWIAARQMYVSIVDYWKNSQLVVDDISYKYLNQAPSELTSEYDKFALWTCYCLAAFFYLLGWLGMAWFTIEAFRLLWTQIVLLMSRLFQ